MDQRAEMLTTLAAEHGPCSVRHLFYAAVVAGVPGITKDHCGYGKVQRQVLDLRRSGRIAYRLVTDSTRWQRKPRTFDGIADALLDIAYVYRRNLWTDSRYNVEVWAESDSIASTIYEVTSRWAVPLMVTRGQSSETFAYGAAESWAEDMKSPVVFYVGDHDPSGLDIEASLRSKLTGFYLDQLRQRMPDYPLLRDRAHVEWSRIGVTWDQVEEHDLPGTPPKVRNRRKPYAYPLSVEAEALPANILRELLDEAIAGYVDQHQLDVLETVEAEERDLLRQMAWSHDGASR